MKASVNPFIRILLLSSQATSVSRVRFQCEGQFLLAAVSPELFLEHR